MIKLGSGVNYHVRVGRMRKHSVTGQMIDVTLRAVSSFLVLGSELGILFGYVPHLPALFYVLRIGKTFCNMRKYCSWVRLF